MKSDPTNTQPTSRFGGDALELQEEFSLHDLDGDGQLSLPEFEKLLNGLESGMSAHEIRIGFAELDTNRDHFISCPEFIAWWTSD